MDRSDTPNVIIIMTDQQRADFSRANGFPLDVIPTIDRLAIAGRSFQRAYTTCPVCLPARSSLITGRFPSAHGLKSNYKDVPAYSVDLVDVFNRSGYKTALIGKDHTYRQAQYEDSYPPGGTAYDLWCYGDELGPPTGVSKEEFARYERWIRVLCHGVSTSPTPFPVEFQQPVRAIDRACRFIDSVAGHPFYLFVGMEPPHNPYQVPEPYFSMFSEDDVPNPTHTADELHGRNDQWKMIEALMARYQPDAPSLVKRYRANYCGMLRLIDDQVSRFLDFLDSKGLRSKTIILFTSDHGDFTGEYGLFRKGVGLTEDLIRIPMTWVGRGIEPAGPDQTNYVSLVDVLPTLCSFIGADTPEGVQGRDLSDVLRGADASDRDLGQVMVEKGVGARRYEFSPDDVEGPRYRLGCRDEGETFREVNVGGERGRWEAFLQDGWKLVTNPYDDWELYNLDIDPREEHNLWTDEGTAARRLSMLEGLQRWRLNHGDPLPSGGFI